MSLVHQPFPMVGRRRAQGWRYQPAFRRPRHFHEESEFNLVVSGHGVFTVAEREVRVGPGDLLWFLPGVDHYLVSTSEDFDLFVVGFQSELLEAVRREHDAAPSFARPPARVDPVTRVRCAELLTLAPEGADDVVVEQRLVGLLEDLAVRTETGAQTLGHRTAASLLADRDARRDELARRLASNRGDVSRSFNRDHGMSLSEFRNRLRILELIRLVEAGEGNLTRAALDAGFGSYSQCHRVFRSMLGRVPRDVLRQELRVGMALKYDPVPGVPGRDARDDSAG